MSDSSESSIEEGAAVPVEVAGADMLGSERSFAQKLDPMRGRRGRRLPRDEEARHEVLLRERTGLTRDRNHVRPHPRLAHADVDLRRLSGGELLLGTKGSFFHCGWSISLFEAYDRPSRVSENGDDCTNPCRVHWSDIVRENENGRPALMRGIASLAECVHGLRSVANLPRRTRSGRASIDRLGVRLRQKGNQWSPGTSCRFSTTRI
jgi:hypothetical protein